MEFHQLDRNLAHILIDIIESDYKNNTQYI
jgi:hypothetical protein